MKRILVRAPNWIGDQVMAYAFFTELRSLYPHAWIAVVCTEWVKDIQFRGLIDEIFVLPKIRKGWIDSFKMIRRIGQELHLKAQWDLGILLPNSFGSALLFHFAGVKMIRGYQTDLRGVFLRQKIKWNPDPSIHRADAYLHLLSPDRTDLPPASDYFSKFDPLKQWPEAIPLDVPQDRYVVIAPGATADSRRWSVENFSRLVQEIHDRWNYRSVVVGGPAEKKIAEEMLRHQLPVQDDTAKGPVSGLWRLFKNAQFVVTNESGLAHVASLCGARVQIVCGAADPQRTKPVGPGLVKVSVNAAVPCWPCEKNSCQFNDHRKNQCHEGISAVRVIQEIQGDVHVSA